jgi:protein Tex
MLIELPVVISRLAAGLSLSEKQVAAAVDLLDAGNTVPFITRYRKDATGGLNETQLRAIQHRLAQARSVDEKRQAILKSLENRAQLSDELRQQILAATTAKHLDDLYLPFKQKKTNQAQQARELGLEPLAEAVYLRGLTAEDFEYEVRQARGADGEVLERDGVLRGVRALLGDFYAADLRLKQKLRRLVWKTGVLKCQQASPPEANRAGGPVVHATRSLNLPQQEVGSCAGGAAVGSAVNPESLPTNGEPPDVVPAVVGVPALPVAPVVDGVSENGERGEAESSTVSAVSELATDGLVSAVGGAVASKRKRKKKKRRQDVLFKDYFQFTEALRKLPPHRVLAINRGQRSKQLRVKVDFDEPVLFQEMIRVLGLEDHPQSELALEAAKELLHRSLLPSFEREVRRELTHVAEEHATQVFSTNLRSLLLQPPTRERRVLAIDPGLKSGCTLAVIDECGEYLAGDKISIVGREEKRQQAVQKLEQLIASHQVGVIAIGNGTGCRETEGVVSQLLAKLGSSSGLSYVIVNEAGASIYSTSEAGKEEFPALEPTVRSAISIGRRLLDPLSELVKINPANIGVGLYQHDVKSKQLEDSLAEIVESCVNYVGVDLNTASVDLLRYVAGLNQLTARRLIEFRQAHGPFKTREQLLSVPGIGQATYVQCAGFLRIIGGEESLDATAIHPESYIVAHRLLEAIGAAANDVAAAVQRTSRDEGWAHKLKALESKELAGQLGVGNHLMNDLIEALIRPGRDPRESLPAPIFRQGILEVEDLVVGMPLQGQVLNVVDFGVFVDIGIGESGLVHISNLSHDYIRDPHQIFSVGDVVNVWVQSIDKKLRRVSLTAISPDEVRTTSSNAARRTAQPSEHKPPRGGGAPQQQRRENGHHSTSRPKHQERRSRNASSSAGRGTARPARPSQRRAKADSRPLKPLSPDMLQGKAPLRSFADLFQYVNQPSPHQPGRDEQ